MEFHSCLLGGLTPITKDVAVKHSATTLQNGALLMRGVTDGTDLGFAVVGASALADIVGLLLEEFASTATDSTQGATYDIKRKVLCAPLAVFFAEYSQDTGDDIAAASSTVTVTMDGTSDDDIDGGYAYVVNSTNSNRQLRVITASASGSFTIKTAFGTALAAATDNIIKIHNRMQQLIVVNTACTKLATTAAVGTGRAVVLENYIQDVGIPTRPLDPVLDSARTLSAAGKLFADICPSDCAYMPLT